MNQQPHDPYARTTRYAAPTRVYGDPNAPEASLAGAGRMPAPEALPAPEWAAGAPERPLEDDPAFLPFYLVADESLSMANEMTALNSGLRRVREALKDQPAMSELAQLSIITFSDSAQRRMEMRPMSAAMQLPDFQTRGATNYTAAFDFLAQCIPADIETIKAQEEQQGRPRPPVIRPVVFFLSDGGPNVGGDWRAARARLEQLHYAPVVVSFGYGQMDPAILEEVATQKAAFMIRQGVTPDVAILEFFNVLLGTVLRSKAVALDPNHSGGIALQPPAADVFLQIGRV